MKKKKKNKLKVWKDAVSSIGEVRDEFKLKLQKTESEIRDYEVFIKNIRVIIGGFDFEKNFYSPSIPSMYRNDETTLSKRDSILKSLVFLRDNASRDNQRATDEARKSEIMQVLLYSVISKEGFITEKQQELDLIKSGFARDPNRGNNWFKLPPNSSMF